MSEAFLELPLVELERLLAAVEWAGLPGGLPIPVTDAGLLAKNLGAARPYVALLSSFDSRESLRIFLECVVCQRRNIEHSPRPELVWSGPEPEHARARHTSVVVRELFEKATREVFIAGYSFQGGDELLAPLHSAMRARGVSVDIVLDCSGCDVYESTSGDEVLRRVVDEFFDEVWIHGDPRPTLYCDPRTLTREQPKYGGRRWFPKHSMHAKCIVVDREEALVGSANFTARAQSANIEVGVVIRERGFAEALLHQWNAVRPQLRRVDLEL